MIVESGRCAKNLNEKISIWSELKVKTNFSKQEKEWQDKEKKVEKEKITEKESEKIVKKNLNKV